MKAVFEVEETVKGWSAPFRKKVTKERFEVSEGMQFSEMKATGGAVFRLVEIGKDKALVEYDHRFTIKGYENPRDKRVWIGTDEKKSFSFLWGSCGTTKTLSLMGIEGNGNEP